jgi:signal transduction histidine kinase/ligand-binding sensor domain-containing protein
MRRVAGVVLLALAAPSYAERLAVRPYTTADGLPCNQVNAVAQDARGFLWVATEDGLSRFDGREFQRFTRAEGLPDIRVNAVVESAAGDLWVGTQAGLSVLAPGSDAVESFQPVALGGTSGAAVIRDLASTPDGSVWVATSDGLFRIRRVNDRRTVERVELASAIDPAQPQVVRSLDVGPDGTLWCGGTQVAFSIAPDGHIGRVIRLPSWDTVNGIAASEHGDVWLATRSGLTRVVAAPGGPDQFEKLLAGREPHELLWMNNLRRTRDGHLWASGSNLTEIDPAGGGRVVRTYDTTNGLCAGGVVSVFEDREGDVWAATQACGVLRIGRSGIVSFDADDGLKPAGIASFVEGGDGNVCATEINRADRWHCYDGRRFQDLTPRGLAELDYVGWSWNQTVVHDSRGEWWVAAGHGLVRYPPERSAARLAGIAPLAMYTRELSLSANSEVFRVFEDAGSNVWIARLGGQAAVVRWDRATGSFRPLSLDGGGAWQGPSAFAQDPGGVVWVAFMQGDLRRVDGDRLVRPAWSAPADAGSIPAMIFDRGGRLWIATGEAGLWRVDQPGSSGTVRVYDRRSGLATDRLLSLAEGADGRIYVGSRSGISVLDPATGRVRQYTTADGLASDIVNILFRDSKGRIWIGTYNGISMLDPRNERPTRPPPAFVTGLSVGGAERPISPRGASGVAGLALAPGESTIQIRLGALAFAPGERPKFQHRLDGDAVWSAPTDQAGITLAHLAPGSYRVLLRAVAPDGAASDPPAAVSFTVRAPFWRSPWFLVSMLAAAGIAVGLALRARVRRLVAIERVRTRIAMDLHDDVGSSLSQIALQGELALSRIERGDGTPAPILERMSQSARELVDTMGDVVWSVDPRHDVISDLARRMRAFALAAESDDGPAVHLDLPSGDHDLTLAADVRRQTYLVFKEALTNALRHAAASRIEVKLEANGRSVVLTVADDGSGIGADPEGPAGHGLASMRRRAQSCRGELSVSGNAGGGTIVALTVPRR